MSFKNADDLASFFLSASTTSTADGYFGDIKLKDDTSPSHYLTITDAENLTADRTLSLSLGDASRSLTFGGNTTLNGGTHSGTNTGDQNAFLTISVSGQSDVVADSASDTLTLVAGTNITITTNAGTDTITIAASGGGVSDGDKGDITISSSGTVYTIDNDVVTYAKMQNVSATDRLLGRSTAGAGDTEEIVCTAAGRALLDDAAATDQRTTLGVGTADSPTFAGIVVGAGAQGTPTIKATDTDSGFYFPSGYPAVTVDGTSSVRFYGAETQFYVGVTFSSAPNSTASDWGIRRSNAGVGTFTDGTFGGTGGGAVEFIEQTAPSAPAADRLRLYCDDSGGTTRLMAIVNGGSTTQIAPMDATLIALAAYNTTGLLVQTAADTFAGRTLTGTSNEISISNGAGTLGNPTFSLPATIDLSGKTSLAIPTSAAPTVDSNGEIAVDTTVTDFSHGIIKYFSGEELCVIAVPIAQFTSPADGTVVKYNATNDEFELGTVSGSGLTHPQVMARISMGF